MSLFNWFTVRKPRPTLPPAPAARRPATRPSPLAPEPRPAAAAPPQRKQERGPRRELLFGVVREAMVRAGVRSSSYRFKVLALDGAGHPFLVMVDVAPGSADAVRMARIEGAITRVARARHAVDVQGVYWRIHEGLRLPQRPEDGRAEAPDTAHPQPAAQNYGLLTGFEDTECEAPQPKARLSATQYGEWR